MSYESRLHQDSMRRLCLAYACIFALLGPFTFSRSDAAFVKNFKTQVTKFDEEHTSGNEDRRVDPPLHNYNQSRSINPVLTSAKFDEEHTDGNEGRRVDSSINNYDYSRPANLVPTTTRHPRAWSALPPTVTLPYRTPTTQEPPFKWQTKQSAMNPRSKPSYRPKVEYRAPSLMKHNNPPTPRQYVDVVVAYVGILLVQRVSEDTFFDLEDGSTRNLALMLTLQDRSPLPPHNWLQFDEKPQELYGVPSPANVGIEEYLLTAIDKNNGKGNHLMKVQVVKGPTLNPQVEFYLSLDTPFTEISYNVKNKRRVIEKLAFFLGYNNVTSNIRIASITDNPTTVKWYDTSLPSDRCPDFEINQITKTISTDGKTLKASVEHIFDDDMKIVSLKIVPIDKCIDSGEISREFQYLYSEASALENDPRLGASGVVNVKLGERRLVTFVIPTVIVACVVFTSLTVLYYLHEEHPPETEYLPCLGIF